ncbi:MAG: phosphoadenosine phosphosulfate reductase family protein [Desulfurococcaceae archaeon]
MFARFDDLVTFLVYGKFISYSTIVELATSLTLEEKVELSHKVIEESLKVAKLLFKEPVASVGFSGGKASLVTLDLVLQHVPRDELIVYFLNTLNEYPGTREYVVKVVKGFFGVRRLVEVLPRITPWEIWRTFGFPRESRDRYYTPVCCVLLKELPAKLVIERYSINTDFTGIQALEALHRLRSIADNGLVRRTRYIGREVTLKKAIIRVAPVGLWLDEDLWEYINRRKLPVNPVYERYKLRRQGCLACTNTRNWREHVESYSRAMLSFIEEKMNEWGVQEERVRLNKIAEKLKVNLRENIESLYIVREYTTE